MPFDMPFGAAIVDGGVRFMLHAPTARDVDVVVDGESHRLTRSNKPFDGTHATIVKSAGCGSSYRFRIDETLLVPDPASRWQPHGIDADGIVVDPAAFEWATTDWIGRPWYEAVIWEAHVGTATREGTFAALAERLPALAELGITAIELMPLADCPGARNWGYDGVLPFAPNAAYGAPDDLRRLVDTAHALGIMIIVDVVYNHFGPAGNYLGAYAKDFFTDRHKTPWGAGLNFDGPGSEAVRAFFVCNALYWIEEYRIDGLRLDAVHAIADDSAVSILDEIAAAVRQSAGGRHVHLILENEDNCASLLARERNNDLELFTAQWNDDIHHCLHILLTGEIDAYYADFADAPLKRLGKALSEGFVYQGERSGNLGRPRGEPSGHLPPTAFVSFLQNHDQIGNRAFGDRISALTTPDKVAFAHEVMLLSPQIPMLFMGEEWSASSPFLYFVDFAHDPALSKAVREGRRQEFARFAAFGDPAKIPDPTALDTFERSKLNWSERTEPKHAAVLARIKMCLNLRRTHVVPLLAQAFIGASYEIDGTLLTVSWRFVNASLRLVANADDVEQRCSLRDWTLVHGPRTDAEGSIVLAPWSCVLARRAEPEALT